MPGPGLGTHAILEVWRCDPLILGDVSLIETIMRAACEAVGATVLNSYFHKFGGGGGGVTGVLALSESSASIHTWPEHGYASVDVYMCGNCDAVVAARATAAALGGNVSDYAVLVRGLEDGQLVGN